MAAYLKREVRTVQRWEKKEGLPIHRLQHDKLGSIYAYKSELDAWWNDRRPRLETQPEAPANGADLEPHEVPAVPAPSEPAPTTIFSRGPRPGFTAANRAAAGVLSIVLLLLVVYSIRQSFEHEGTPRPQGKLMLLVLPFENLSGDPTQEHFSDGLTDELITELSQLQPEELGVIARTTAMLYKKTQKSAEEVARELGVQYILEGTVRKEGDRLRITGQLIQASDQANLWAQAFDRELKSVLAVQSEVAAAIASQIQLKLTAQKQAQLRSPREVNAEAYELYLWGRQFSLQRSPEGILKGIDFFQQALQKDPGYAQAYAALSDALNLVAFYGLQAPQQTYPKARAAAEKALSLDESLAEGHAALANLSYDYEYNWEKADRAFRRAIELNPNYAQGRHWYAQFLVVWGRIEASRREIEIAQRLDPLSVVIATDVALIEYYARNYGRAVEIARKVTNLAPDYPLGQLWLGRALLMQGKQAEAITVLKKAVEVQPGNPLTLTILAHAYATTGRKAEARTMIRQLEEAGRQKYLSPAFVAVIYVGLGEYDRALDFGERGYEERAGLLTRLEMEPISDGMRALPRFQALVRKLGLTPKPTRP